jgi:predicted RNA binding protein YcfA (HicA-like mRNA interferase family)
MKRRDLLKKLTDLGCTLTRNGSKHDWYTNPKTQTSQAIPRHNEIDEHLAKTIIKALSK